MPVQPEAARPAVPHMAEESLKTSPPARHHHTGHTITSNKCQSVPWHGLTGNVPVIDSHTHTHTHTHAKLSVEPR